MSADRDMAERALGLMDPTDLRLALVSISETVMRHGDPAQQCRAMTVLETIICGRWPWRPLQQQIIVDQQAIWARLAKGEAS